MTKPTMTKEALLKVWFDTQPTVRSNYTLYGCPPMWPTLEHDDKVLFTRPGRTMDRPAPYAPYVEVDGVHWQWQKDGKWVLAGGWAAHRRRAAHPGRRFRH